MLLEALSDERGTINQVSIFLACVIIAGILLGVILPKDTELNGPIYPYISSCTGYTYFAAWSASFYPQVILNYQRQSTIGLSLDFCLLNVFGYACYSIYTCAFLFNKSIREEYRMRHHGTDPTVEPSDVAFAVHALFLSSAWLLQIGWYNSDRRPSHWVSRYVVLLLGIVILAALGSVDHKSKNSICWLNFCYVLSSVKVMITITKYVPQAFMNYKRKSTRGWTIWNVVLDLTGGLFSFIQLAMDSWNINNWDGITGNPAKLGISLISIFFDVSSILS